MVILWQKRNKLEEELKAGRPRAGTKVYTPDQLGKYYLGDTIANDPESVVGRVMQTTLGEIINDYARQNVKMRFRVANVAGDAAYTEFVGHEVTRDYLRSLVKRLDFTDRCPYTGYYQGRQRPPPYGHLLYSHPGKPFADPCYQGHYYEIRDGTGPEWRHQRICQQHRHRRDFKRVFKMLKEVFPIRRVEIIKSKVEIPVISVAT